MPTIADQHYYEGVEVLAATGAEGAITLLSSFADPVRARRVALAQAYEFSLAEGVGSVKVYHSHPSPGPQKQYIGRVYPSGTFVDCNGNVTVVR